MNITNEQLTKLEKLAQNATPSPWYNSGPDDHGPGEFVLGGGPPDSANEGLVAVAVRYGHHEKDKANANHIAAMDPDTVLALIAEMRLLREKVKADCCIQLSALQKKDNELRAAQQRAIESLKELASLRNRIEELEFENSQVIDAHTNLITSTATDKIEIQRFRARMAELEGK